MKKTFTSLLLGIVLVSYGSLVHAAILIVPDDYSTIQGGINAAVDGDEIMVRDGTYNELVNFNGKAIRVYSENGVSDCIIDGDVDGDGTGDGSVVTFASGEVEDSILEGFTIQNGFANHGGGIYCYDHSSPTIIKCTTTENRAGWGGGIYCELGASPTMSDCTITGNTADNEGGGIYCSYGSSPTITNFTIIANAAEWGGGIHCEYSAIPAITNCIIAGNISTYGGGVSCSSGSSPAITNCTIVGNASTYGGGISCLSASSPTITNCTITGNTSAYGGGIYSSYGSSPEAVNCIIWGDEAGGAPNEIYLGGSSSISIAYSDVEGGWIGAGNINTDPLFADATNGNYHLQSNSACIDTGTDDTATYTSLPTDDIDGDFRALDGNSDGTAQYDMGSDEYALMSATLQTNATEFTTGEEIVIKTLVNNYTSSDIVVDAILEVVLPDSSTLLLNFISGVTITGNLSNFLHTLLANTFLGTEASGTYSLRFIVRRTSDQIVLSGSKVDFNFSP